MVSILKRFEVLAAVVIILTILAIQLPLYTLFKNYELFISTLALIFTIISGFTIASVWNEFQAVGTASAREVGEITNIYQIISGKSKPMKKKLRDMLDKYIIFEYVVDWDKIDKTNKVFYGIGDFLRKGFKVKTPKDSEIYDNMLDSIDSWERAREEQIHLGTSKIPTIQWIVLIILGLLFISLLYLIRDGTMISTTITVAVSFSILLFLGIIYDLDTYSFGVGQTGYKSFQQLFDMIGKPRFYWEDHIKNKLITPPKNLKKYRTKIPREYLKDLK